MKFSLIGLLCFIPFLTIAQSGISGQITDETTGQALDYATVSIYTSADSSLVTGNVTDAKGQFVLSCKPGNYFLKVDFISYESKIVNNIQVGRKIKDVGTINLSTGAMDLDAIEVRAEKSSMQIALDKKVFNVGADLANQGGSAEDILDNVPSVTVDVDGAVSLRGQGNVRILVDGKPSSLTGADGGGLKGIPANMIDKVEVVTNPSARYDAEGMTGIINIVLKKDKKSGLNGSFDINVGYPDLYGAAINMNYRKNKVNLFLNYGGRYRKGPGGGTLYQEIYSGDSTFILDQTREHTRGGWSQSIRTGLDYFIGKKTTLTGALSYRTGLEENQSVLEYKDYLNSYANPLGSSTRTDNESEDETNLEYSINFKKDFDKKDHKWTADIQYSLRAEVEASDIDEIFFDENGQRIGTGDLFQTSDNDESFTNLLFQTDYVYPFKEKGRFELGARINLRDVKNDVLVQELQGNTWITLDGLSNNFHYDENIYALYSSYGDKIGKFSYQLGLRYELSNIETFLEQTNESNPRDYSNFFPSAFINYEFNKINTIQASYSKRIRRPRFRELNPFFTFSDARNFFSGNPDVNPEFTDSYEISYIMYLDKASVSSSAYYRKTEGIIRRIRTVDSQTGNTLTQPYNIGFDDSYGLELNFSYNPYKWWRLNGDANFFRSITDGREYSEDLYSDTYTWFGRVTSRMTFWKDFDVQLRGNYRAPRETPQGRNDARYHLDIAMSKDILKKKGTLTFNVRDVFNSRRRIYEQFNDNFYANGDWQWRQRQFTLSFNYRLNQKKKRGRGGRGGGNEGGGEF